MAKLKDMTKKSEDKVTRMIESLTTTVSEMKFDDFKDECSKKFSALESAGFDLNKEESKSNEGSSPNKTEEPE